MSTARIRGRQARQALDLASDPDIYAAQEVEAMYAEREEIERLIEEVDRELAAEAGAAGSRALRPFTDVERVRRSQRRAVRVALSRLDCGALAEGAGSEGEAA